MEKIWYLFLDEIEEGPFSIDDLKGDMRISPETFVWREGFDTWLMAGDVEELNVLFEEETVIHPHFVKKEFNGNDVVAESLNPDLFFRWFSFFILFFLFLYLIYRLYA